REARNREAVMIKTVLMLTSGLPSDAATYEAALPVLRAFEAHLNVLHVHLDAQELVVSMATSDPSGGLAISGFMDDMLRDADLRMDSARRDFDALCAREGLRVAGEPGGTGPSAEWTADCGDEAARLGEHGRAADLLVMRRPPNDGELPMNLLETALLQTGRPLLLVPPGPVPPLLGTIAIAWKDTPEAAHAVAAAAPFLARAERVVIFSVEEQPGEHDPSCDRLARALRWHNPNVAVRHLPGDQAPAEVLVAAARELRAGMLVMGGYGHSRLREIVFGGFTRHVLRGVDVPVLMAH
ncbi:MAG TPA: universal stress protein, partial [Acetobacteraceae bacterium]